ncbi:hypothetical protein BC828DRAFT_374759 [Blastocladiella britannica]|nr:hypothetical protein BC828DRAFT_374759 [Blastocladiella britannica]
MAVSAPRRADGLRGAWTKWVETKPTAAAASSSASETKTAVAVARAALAERKSTRSMTALWDVFASSAARFSDLALVLARTAVLSSAGWADRAVALDFLSLCFQCIEVELVRKDTLRLISIASWSALGSKARLDRELAHSPALPKKWRAAQRQFQRAATDADRDRLLLDQSWLSSIVLAVLDLLSPTSLSTLTDTISGDSASLDSEDDASAFPVGNSSLEDDMDLDASAPPQVAAAAGTTSPSPTASAQLEFLCRGLQLLVVLEGQLPTRRHVHAVLMDHGLLGAAERAAAQVSPSSIVSHWLALLRVYLLFAVDEHSGTTLTRAAATAQHEQWLALVQRQIFAQHPAGPLVGLALVHLEQLQDAEWLRTVLESCEAGDVDALVQMLALRDRPLGHGIGLLDHADDNSSEAVPPPMPLAHKISVIVDALAHHASPVPDLREIPLVPVSATSMLDAQPPPLALQYLSISDYLFRHLVMYRAESAYGIRAAVHDAVGRLRPEPAIVDSESPVPEFAFPGNKISVPMVSCSLSSIGKPGLFDHAPSHVEVEIGFSLAGMRPEVTRQWDDVARGELMYLAVVEIVDGKAFVKHVRAGFLDNIFAHDGRPVRAERTRDELHGVTQSQNNTRSVRVAMDRWQHYYDKQASLAGHGDDPAEMYASFNVLVRRPLRENNYWAVLDALREYSAADHACLPPWLTEVFLGYGNPTSVGYANIEGGNATYFHSTFVDREHLDSSFPGWTIEYEGATVDRLEMTFDDSTQVVRAVQRPEPPMNLFAVFGEQAPSAQAPRLRFTPRQVEAIRAGSSRGLSLVIGPPGTGKTDVAVQVLSNMYHANPEHRILLLTHSNQALGQLFLTLQQLDQIPERHLLRLGHSDDDGTARDSGYGRVSHYHERRATLLYKVGELSESLGIAGAHNFSLETTVSFFRVYVFPLWDMFVTSPAYSESVEALAGAFPFTQYFAMQHPTPLFDKCTDLDQAQSVAGACWRHVRAMYTDAEQSQAMDVLRTERDRINLLLARDARVVAMTTTFAALKYRELRDMGFTFHSLIMEEAGTVLEAEAFVPLGLAAASLERVVLIGDPHQLPPVVQNPVLHGVAQSLYVRLLRLGVPAVQLDVQGRSRKSLCALYSHVYPGLGHLPAVDALDAYANPGLVHDYQFIEVGGGHGETVPVPGYIQNLAEAEYVVATFQYLRLLGYPSERITILTTYRGQKDLISEVLSKRCAWDPTLIGTVTVATVDRYQGQQNDFVLLSLVRTRSAGHLADERRLVVAMSRARLGLYVFGRQAVFTAIAELKPTFNRLLARPTRLQLVPSERFVADDTSCRSTDAQVPAALVEEIKDVAAMMARVERLAQEVELERMDDMDVDIDDTSPMDVVDA